MNEVKEDLKHDMEMRLAEAVASAELKVKSDAPVETPNEFALSVNCFGLWQIKLSAGGVTPAELKGTYTDEAKASIAIKGYKLSKGKTDVKESFAA